MTATTIRTHFRLDFPDDLWRPNESLAKPMSRLKLDADVTINGTSMHVEAIEVYQLEERVEGEVVSHQRAVGAESIDDLDLLGELTASDGPFTTVRLHGRNYVVVLTPFCE